MVEREGTPPMGGSIGDPIGGVILLDEGDVSALHVRGQGHVVFVNFVMRDTAQVAVAELRLGELSEFMRALREARDG